MNRNKLVSYGQEFEEEEDEKGIVSKKPTPIQDQIATDEKGKRRFHGAFTGGFSAGYWNTVGSKHGWVPQVFSSSRDNRGDKVKQRAEDFMDDEDLGEFGIGSRSIKRTATFGDNSKRKLAWERESTSVSSIAKMFEDVVKPVSDSIGVRMLRSMGWREGRGIGLVNVKQKMKRGGETEEAGFDREQAGKVAASYEFSNEDVIVKQLTPLTGNHGIGYEGLESSSVLNESYGKTAAALKANSKSKGIRGQAFGVGVFEEDDESIYTNYDLSQFDFSLDVSGRGLNEASTSVKSIDATFELQPKKLNSRKFYAPPRMPPNFRGEHKPIALDVQRLPVMMVEDARNMTAMQRAKFLGEDRLSVLELVSSKDRKRLERRSRWDIKVSQVGVISGGEIDEVRDRLQRNRVEFPDEPMKQARFKGFLHYIRRGLSFPQPTDLSVWEWESEKKEFESKLTSEEKSMLPEVNARSQPLVRSVMAAPIHEMMASKFVKESSGELQVGRKDEDKLSAVKMEMFGEKTRQSFEWYPDSLLAKRFNVPNPYPDAPFVGVPHLQKTLTRKDNLMDIGLPNIGLPNTARELEMRDRMKERYRRKNDEEEEKRDEEINKENENSDSESESEDESTIKEANEKAPKSFFDYVFGESSDEEEKEDSDEEREEEMKREERRMMELKKRREEMERKKRNEEEVKKKEEEKKDVIFVEDEEIQILDDKKTNENNDNESYGPAIPENLSETGGLSRLSVLKYLQEDLKKRREEKEKRKKSKKSKKEKKSKKMKKHKKEKKRKRESSTSDSSEWEEEK